MSNLDLERFPVEVWGKIFQELPSPKDLSAVALSSKAHYNLVVRELYRRLHWSDARAFALCQPVLHRQPMLMTYPTSLTVSVACAGTGFQTDTIAPAIVEPRDATNHLYSFFRRAHHRYLFGGMDDSDNEGIDFHHAYPVVPASRTPLEHTPRRKDITYVASPTTSAAMFIQIGQFVNLRSLTFDQAVIPREFYELLPDLLSLRDLTVSQCRMPHLGGMGPDDIDVSCLQLASLTIREYITEGASQTNRRCLYKLATTPTLRSLCISWTRLASDYLGLTQSIVLSQILESLTIAIPSQGPADLHGPGIIINPPFAFHAPPPPINLPPQPNVNALEQLLRKVPSVHTLRLATRSTKQLPTSLPNVLPRLRSYTGPVNEILSLGGSDLQRLDMTVIINSNRSSEHNNSTDNVASICNHIHTFGLRFPNLSSLSFFVNEYSEEWIYAVAQSCPHLEHLKIRYGSGGPEENVVLSLGAIHLHQLPNLQTFHMYNPQIARPSPEPETPPSMRRILHPGEGISDPPPDWPELYLSRNYAYSKNENQLLASNSNFSLSTLNEDDMRELILPWSKPCPELKEIQLVGWNVWRRAFHGDSWCLRDFNSGQAQHNKKGDSEAATDFGSGDSDLSDDD